MEDRPGGSSQMGVMQKAMTSCEGLAVRRRFCHLRDAGAAAQCGRVSGPAEKTEQRSGVRS